MLSGILGKKVGMTHVFTEEGKNIPVTVIQAGPVYVTQIKTVETDGYNAIQVGFEAMSDKKLTFPKHGHLKKAGVATNLRHMAEFRVDSTDGYELGQEIKVDIFSEGEKIDLTSKSKGRGFAGGVKRHHFKGQHMTHGFMTHRRPNSSGATGPQRVFKGTKKPGHMGDAQITQQGSRIVGLDAERNLIWVSGSVPGAPDGLVRVTKAGK